MFMYNKKIEKNEIQTTYGSICIENIYFDPCEIEQALPDIVLADDNLMHMFAEEELNPFRRRNIYRRFIPQHDTEADLETYIDQNLQTNRSFYSFLAEGILGLVYRDVYGYNLAKCVIDVRDTLSDSHTGVDACMYDCQNQIIVLGEAKFYKSFDSGIKAIIDDFIHKNITNKLESLKAATENDLNSNRIVIKNLSKEEYEEKTLEEFMQQKIVFAGFVLHSESDIEQYNKEDVYDNYQVSSIDLKNNICNSLKVGNLNGDYSIIFVHLPVEQKRSLILKMIEAAKGKLRNS